MIRKLLVRALVLFVFLYLFASSAEANFIFVSGQLQATAHAQAGIQSHHAPPDVILGSELGAFSLNAHAQIGSCVGDITVHTDRTPTSIIQGFDGQATGGLSSFAWTSGNATDFFTITEPHVVRIRSEATSFQAQMGVTLRQGDTIIYQRVQVVDPVIDVLNLAPGTYSLRTGGGHINGDMPQPPASALVTFTIIPEPTFAGMMVIGICALVAGRGNRGAQARSFAAQCDSFHSFY